MRITEKTPVTEIYQKAYNLYQLRILTILLLIPLYILTCTWAKLTINIWPLYLILFVEVFLNKPYKIFFRNSYSGYEALLGAVFIDFLAETAALHLLGNVDLFIYSACFFVSIVYCALNLPTVLVFQFAALASGLYGGLILLGHLGIIPQTISFGPNLSLAQETAIVCRHIAFFFFIALLVRFLANALVKKEDRMQDLIWELRETSEKLKYSYHLQTDYFARMSHEIRSPLNSILGFSQLLLENSNDPLTPKQKDFLARIERGARHLRELINDVLDLSKIESKKMQLAVKEIDLVKIIDSVVDIFYEEALHKQILLGFPERPDSIKITADELKLRQVLYNLLSNALKFTPKGFVRVSLKKEAAGAKIVVEDSGIGIAKGNQETIFQPYEQTGRATAPNVQGSGLGLAISKQFVEMHGGKIWVESEMGKGSKFVISLPFKPIPPKSDEPMPVEVPPLNA